jgi:hypothetical protein
LARYGKKDGFNVDNIVKVDNANSNANVNASNNANDNVVNNNTPNAIEKLKTTKQDKERVFVYLDKDLAYKVKSYGKQIGKWRGGNSKIVSEALKMYFKKNNL